MAVTDGISRISFGLYRPAVAIFHMHAASGRTFPAGRGIPDSLTGREVFGLDNVGDQAVKVASSRLDDRRGRHRSNGFHKITTGNFPHWPNPGFLFSKQKVSPKNMLVLLIRLEPESHDGKNSSRGKKAAIVS
jgi:hypothetical protein